MVRINTSLVNACGVYKKELTKCQKFLTILTAIVVSIFSLGIATAPVFSHLVSRFKRLNQKESKSANIGQKLLNPIPKTSVKEFIYKHAESVNPYVWIKKIGYKCDKTEAEQVHDKEAFRLECFLKSSLEKGIEHDLIYVSFGHEDVDEQVWPGFIFQELEKDKKVITLLFEYHKYYDIQILQKMKKAYGKTPFDNKILENFTLKEFLCGFPCDGKPSRDTATEKEMSDYQLIPNTIFWKSEDQKKSLQEDFHKYLTAALSSGKKVVLGMHAGALSLDQPLIKFYNELIQKHPGQLFLVWGHMRKNLVTDQPITQNFNDTNKESPIWKHYPQLSQLLSIDS